MNRRFLFGCGLITGLISVLSLEFARKELAPSMYSSLFGAAMVMIALAMAQEKTKS